MLKNIDPTVKQETLFCAACVAVLTLLMEAVFLVSGFWDMSVLWGGLLGAFAAILNFFLMAVTVQKAVGKEEKDAKSLMKASQSMRLIMLLCFCALGAAVDAFHLIATIVPLLFPRVGVTLRGLMLKKQQG